MSRWFQSVGNLLEQLDTQAENVSDAVEILSDAVETNQDIIELDPSQTEWLDAQAETLSDAEQDSIESESSQTECARSEATEETDSEDLRAATEELESFQPEAGKAEVESLSDRMEVVTSDVEIEQDPTELEASLTECARSKVTAETLSDDLQIPMPSPDVLLDAESRDSIPSPHEDAPEGLLQETAIARSANAMESTSRASDAEETKQLMNKIQSLQTQLEKATVELESSQTECARAKAAAKTLSDDLRAAMEELESFQSEAGKAKAKVKSLTDRMEVLTSELKSTKVEYGKAQAKIKTFSDELEVANAEIAAQRDELHQAGEQMEKERAQLQEDREDLLDEHDEEIEQLKEEHEKALTEQKQELEAIIEGLRDQLQNVEQTRTSEEGNWASDLNSAIEREKDALSRLASITDEKEKLEKSYTELQIQSRSDRDKLDESINAAKAAAERERAAESKLDAAMSGHAHQMAQRQSREAELEKTIFDLGAALTKQKNEMKEKAQDRHVSDAVDYKGHYERSAEELETAKAQLMEEIQVREALQQQLGEISNERAAEESRALEQQRRDNQKVADLEVANSQLSATIRELEARNSSSSAQGAGQEPSSAAEAGRYKNEYIKTSEQLLQQKQRAETYKAEILALKGRLQSANQRAEDAEAQAQKAYSAASQVTSLEVMESGGVYSNTSSTTMRRRVKGGNRMRGVAAQSAQARSIRSALRLNPGRVSPGMETVASTLDALDKWMMDTAAVLRHEPLARFGCMVYFITLHLFSFALVVFHTTEQPHADFGHMDTNPRHWRPR